MVERALKALTFTCSFCGLRNVNGASYCEGCGELVHDIEFDCKDIVEHFRDTMELFWKDDAKRTCKNCGKQVEKPVVPEA